MSADSGVDETVAYPFAADPARGTVFMLPMRLRDFRAASFLDERLLEGRSGGNWLAREQWTALAEAIEPQPLHFIFHIGHAGSTLISRLLDETGVVLGLREPLALRQMAEAFDFASGDGETERLAQMLDLLLRQWAQPIGGTTHTILKATSSAARLARRLLTLRPEARALYLHLDAETYLATLLAGANSAQDLNAHGPERLFRLRRNLRDDTLPQPQSLGELAAMSFLAETMTRKAVTAQFGTRVQPLDFHAFLQNRGHHIARILRHFGLDLSADATAALTDSAVFQQYSKAPEQHYSPGERAQILARAGADYADEIARGKDWLDRMASRHEAAKGAMMET